jgi:hypothetical protein
MINNLEKPFIKLCRFQQCEITNDDQAKPGSKSRRSGWISDDYIKFRFQILQVQ